MKNVSELNQVTKTKDVTQEAVSKFDTMPDGAMIRPNVAKVIISVSIATLWRLIRDGKLKTYKLTERTTTIKVGDLRAFIASKAGV